MSSAESTTTPSTPLPAVFLSHGGGPSFQLDFPKGSRMNFIGKGSDCHKWLQNLSKQVNLEGSNKPKAILVVTAHWVTTNKKLRVSSQVQHKQLYFDYGGFPDYTYKFQYNAPGNPELSKRIVNLLGSANIECSEDTKRNFDHGIFVPLLEAFPAADIPVVALSIDSSYDPDFHVKVGKALEPLRSEGVLIIGSGSATHNMGGSESGCKSFIKGLNEVLVTKHVKSDGSVDYEQREKDIINWEKIPGARQAHAEEDHFIPIHVIAGAGHKSGVKKLCEFWSENFAQAAYSFQ